MIRVYWILFLIVINIKVSSQPTWQLIPIIERNAYTLLEGSIDNKYPITMYLETTWNYCGPHDNYKWNSRIFKGWYEYKRVGKRIPLIGSIDQGDEREYFLKLYVLENLLDTLEGKTCIPKNYKEMFFIPEGYYLDRYSLDTMQWSKFDQEGFLPTYLKEIHSPNWKTNASLMFKVDGIELLEIDLTKLANNEFIDKVVIESSKHINDQFFFIVRFGHLTFPGWLGSGHCGAGWEGWLCFLQIDKNLEVAKFEIFQNDSCNKYIDTEYTFNKDFPEYGITAKKY